MGVSDRVTTKEYREIKDFLKKGQDYVGAMRKFQRSWTTVRRIDASSDWWEYRSHKGLRVLRAGKDSQAPKVRHHYEQIPDKKFERSYRAMFIAGLIKDISIIGLITLGLIKLIGG